MYTPIVLPADLNNLIYPEIQNEITRNDGGALATAAIAMAIEEVQIYLSRYDLVQLFGAPTASPPTSATFPVPNLLKQFIIKIAAWNLITLCNANVLYESMKDGYEHTIHTLRDIQKGIGAPQWPIYEPPAPPTGGAGQVIIVNTPIRNTSGYCNTQDLDQ